MAIVDGEKYGCEHCVHYEREWEGEMGQTYYENFHCNDRPHMANLRTFPFESAPVACFRLEFWNSRFVLEIDGSNKSIDKAFEAYTKWYQETYPDGEAKEDECSTCHGVGEVTLTVMRKPDEYQNVACPDCCNKEAVDETL